MGPMKLPFQEADPAHSDFQYLEDLATAYWYSEVLFAALELRLFDLLEQGCCRLDDLAATAGCDRDNLHRLLDTMERLELVHNGEGEWFNSQLARLYLAPGNPSYMGDFLLYRRYMQPTWMDLVQRVSAKRSNAFHVASKDDDYEIRTLRYVRALDQLAKQKAQEIVTLLTGESWKPPLLDIGGGAGSLSRALIGTREQGYATVLDLPEVIAAAQLVYPDKAAWERVRTISGDFRSCEFPSEASYGLVVLSNFLHAYGAVEARRLLGKSVGLLANDGLLLIHDYFPDRLGRSPEKGPLYDLNMMLNTYDGTCHKAHHVMGWLRDEGMGRVQIRDLATDSSIILAGRKRAHSGEKADLEEWVYLARTEGFRRGVLVPGERIVTAPWARMKCGWGCSRYGQNLQCPPRGLESCATREILDSYTWALLLEGAPPSRVFHQNLLRMEKRAFLAGFYKAFALGAGPCPVCEKCPEDGICRYPDQARPSMEGSGIDVYTTARAAGIRVKPVTEKDRYVKYIGLLLLE